MKKITLFLMAFLLFQGINVSTAIARGVLTNIEENPSFELPYEKPVSELPAYRVYNSGNKISISTRVPIAGLQFETSGDWNLAKSLVPTGWTLRENDGTALIYTLSDKTITGKVDLFNYSGNLTINETVAADRQGELIPRLPGQTTTASKISILTAEKVKTYQNFFDSLSAKTALKAATSTTLFAGNASGVPGQNGIVYQISMTNNSNNVSGVQFNLNDLPNWVSVSGAVSRLAGFDAYANDYNGSAEVMAIDMSGGTMPIGSNIPLVNLYLNMDSGATLGDIINMNFSNIVISDIDGNPLVGEGISGTISAGTKGDVNSDGEINILDIVKVINFSIHVETPTPSQLWASDMNSNGQINVLDVVQIINIAFITEPEGLSIELATDTPPTGYTYMNATHVPFTKVKLTAGSNPVTIDSMIIERTGAPASDGAFMGVNILKGEHELLSPSYRVLNSSHQTTFTEDVVVPANGTVYLTLVGKIADVTTYAGEAPTLSLIQINTLDTLHGTLPIVGNPKTINGTINIGDITVSESPDLSTLTEVIGTPDVQFLNVKLANDSASANIRVDSIRFNNVGSANDTDANNLELVVDGNIIATSTMINNYVTFNLESCGPACLITHSTNETFQLRGDIVGGSGRTLDFDVKKADDIMAYDTLNMTYVTPSAAIDGGRTVTISRGILTVTKTNLIPPSNIPEGLNNIDLGSWNFKVEGEPITINTIKFDIDVTGTVSSSDFTDLRLLNSIGTALTGATDGVDGSTSAKDGSVTFNDSFILPVGDNTIKLTGNLSVDGANADTVQFGVDFTTASTANLDAVGNISGDAISLSATASNNYANPYGVEIDANLMTIATPSLIVTTLSTPAAQTISAGVSGQTFSTIRFDASASSENVKVTAFEFYITTGAAAESNKLQNITFTVNGTPLSVTKNGTQTDATDEEISVSLSGADQFVIPKGTAVNMVIEADVSAGATAGATATYKMDITSTNSNVVTASGATSGNDINAAEGTAAANAMTIGTAGGTMEISLDSNNPEAALMAGGTTVNLAKFKFYATSTEDIELDYLYLTQVVIDTLSSSYLNYDEIWFVDEAGTEIVGTRMTPTSTKPYINFADNAFVVNYSDTNGEILTLKARLANIGISYSGTSDHAVGYKINASADVVAKGDMTGSGSTEYLGTTAPTGNTNYVYKGYPVFARVNMTTALANGQNKLFKFTVTAVNSDVALYKFTFDLVTSSATVTNMYIYDVTGTEVVLDTAAVQPSGVDIIMTYEALGTAWDGAYNAGDAVVVSSGTTRTFEVRGDVAGATTGSSVQVRMGGDAAHVAGTTTLLHTAAGVDSDVNDDFIWSDMSIGSHYASTADWTNGFLVSGLSSPSTSAQVTAL